MSDNSEPYIIRGGTHTVNDAGRVTLMILPNRAIPKNFRGDLAQDIRTTIEKHTGVQAGATIGHASIEVHVRPPENYQTRIGDCLNAVSDALGRVPV